MSKKIINIGIIGCGNIAQNRHIPEYASNSNVKIIGYFDFTRERAEKMAEQYGGKVYDKIDDLLNDEKITAISVCLANAAHAKVSIAALNSGKDVLCEKPMATTLKDSKAMVKAAQVNKRVLMIDQNQRFEPVNIKAKKLIGSGLIGNVLTFKSNFGHGGPETWSVSGNETWFFDKNKSKYGAIFDLGIHKMDLIQYLINSPISAVSAKLATLDKKDSKGDPIGVDDNGICLLELKNGVIGTVVTSWTYYGEEDKSTVIYGSQGIMKLYDDPKFPLKVMLKDGQKIYYDLGKKACKTGVIDEFISSLIENRIPKANGGSVINSMKAVFGCVESDKLGKRIEIL